MSQILPNGQINSDQQKSGLLQLLVPIAGPLKSVNEMLLTQMGAGDSILQERLQYSGLAAGKRMRPALLLLAGSCFGDIKKPHIAAATAIELVHVATLVHDDVLDEADQRRHSEAIHSRWDNTTSILTGDYLFSKAFEVGCLSGSLEAIRRIASASSNVCRGEITQNALAGNFEISEEQYFEIISLKTAELCRCACSLGALLSECDEQMVTGFEQFGTDLGIAFQIIDDVLDIVGRKETVGKTLGTDLVNKKATLPVIHWLEQIGTSDRQLWVNKLETGNWELPDVLQQLQATNSISFARQTARDHAHRALKFADSLRPSQYSKSLVHLAEFIIERTY